MPNDPKPTLGDKTLEELCDWCGKPFADGEPQLPGYLDQPTHKACVREARRAWRHDQDSEHGELPREWSEREPFTDWPNGQGTYD